MKEKVNKHKNEKIRVERKSWLSYKLKIIQKLAKGIFQNESTPLLSGFQRYGIRLNRDNFLKIEDLNKSIIK